MAAEFPRRSAHAPRNGALWSRERIATALVPRRDALVAQLPRELAVARGLSSDQAELVVDEAIDYMVTEYDKPITTPFELERAFWAAASFRVRRVHEGRNATVRAGWRRVDVNDMEIAAPDGDPAASVIERDERQVLLEFAATLTPHERTILACKYGEGPSELGRKLIAKRLGSTPAEVRRAERSIARKLAQFAAVLGAGALCAHRGPALQALAENSATSEQTALARAHLAHCARCRVAYAAHMRAIQTGELQRRIASLLPLPIGADVSRRRGGLWDHIADWVSRPFSPDALWGGSQAAVAGRGVGTVAAAKLAMLCIGGAAVVGGGAFCISTLTPHDHPQRAAPPAHARVAPQHVVDAHDRLPHKSSPSAAVTTALHSVRHSSVKRRATPTPTPTPTSVTTANHERATAISPPTGGSTGGASEFTPAPASSAPPAPAAPAAGGGPEFP